MTEFELHDGVKPEHIEDALRISYDAFQRKFRIGFSNSHHFVRMFKKQIDSGSCITATVNGDLAGILTILTREQEFYKLSFRTTFSEFNPVRATRIILNLVMFASEGRPAPDELSVDSVAVDPNHQGLGIGTALLKQAEVTAQNLGKRRMSLSVIDENTGAKRLYERLGYSTVKTDSGLCLRLVVGTQASHLMRKPL